MHNQTRFAGWLLLWLACFAITISAGCGSSRKKGPISQRLLGKWECRKGFAGTISLHFKDDGSMDVNETRENSNKGYTAHWYLVEDMKDKKEDPKDQLLIQMQTKKGGNYEARAIKFLSADNFELKSGAKVIGRFQQLGK